VDVPPNTIRLTPRVLEITRHFFETNKPVASICHGAQVLTAAGVVKGRRVSAYPAVGPDVTNAGGIFVDINADDAIKDGNLVTAPAWPAHQKWLALFLEVLGTKISG